MAQGKITKNQISEKQPFQNITEDAKIADASVKSLELTLKGVIEVAKKVKKSISGKDPVDNKGIRERNELLKKSDTLVKAKIKAEKDLKKANEDAIKLRVIREKGFDRFEKKQAVAAAKAVRARQAEVKASIKSRKETLLGANAYETLNKQVRSSRERFKRLAAQHGVNSRAARRAAKRYGELNGKLLMINRSARKAGGGLSRFGGIIKGGLGVLGIGTAIASLGRILGRAGQGIIDFDEGVADLAKVTGLAKTEARELAKEVLKIDTKTPVKELLALATAGGRLGLSGRDLIQFTEQADQAFVALGDSLEGSAEDIGVSLGKIAANFGLEKKFGISKAMAKIGSSMNDLGAKSKANEGRILDFTNRISGVAIQANLALPDVQALGALFDETGQSIEVSASTINKLLPAIGKDTKRFARVAGMDIREFEKLVSEKPLEALKAVAKGAKSSTKGLKGLSKTLEAYGIKSSRSASIVGILSDKTDRLTELQGISNEAFEKGTSLADEFALKNETLGAKVQKLGNNFDKLVISVEDGNGVMSKFFSTSIDGMNKMLVGLTKIDNAFGELIDRSIGAREEFIRAVTEFQLGEDNPLVKFFQNLEDGVEESTDNMVVSFRKMDTARQKSFALKIEQRILRDLKLLDTAQGFEQLNIERRLKANQLLLEKLKIITEVTEEATKADFESAKVKKQLTGIIEIQSAAVGRLNERIIRATSEEQILKLSLELDVEKKELDRLKRIVSSTMEEINKIELDLIEDQTEKRIAKEEEKSRKLIEKIRSNSRAEADVKQQLIFDEEKRLDLFIEDQNIKELKKAIDHEAALSKAEIEQRRTGFETEEEFEKFKAEQFKAIKRNQLKAELDVLEFYERAEDKLKTEQLKAQIQGLEEFGKKSAFFTEKQAEDNAKALQFIEDIAVKNYEAKIDRLEDEEQKSRDQLDEFKQAARDGNITAKESLAEQQRLADEAAREQEKTEQKKQNVLLVTAVLQAFNSELAKTNDVGKALATALTSTAALSQFASALPSFLDGIENTGSHGKGIDGKGGFHAVLHPNERVMTEGQNAMIGDASNEDVARVMHNYRMGNILTEGAVLVNDNAALISEFSGLKKEISAVKKAIIDKPETNISLGEISQSAMFIKETTRRGNRTITNRFKVN